MDIEDFQMQLIDFKASLLCVSKFVDLQKSLEIIENPWNKHFSMLEIFAGEIWLSEDGNSFAVCIWILLLH